MEQGQRLPPATSVQQTQIAILRALAYRLTHPSDQHACSWWQEAPREGTTRVSIDIDTADLRDLIARIEHSPIGRRRPDKSEPLPPQPRR